MRIDVETASIGQETPSLRTDTVVGSLWSVTDENRSSKLDNISHTLVERTQLFTSSEMCIDVLP